MAKRLFTSVSLYTLGDENIVYVHVAWMDKAYNSSRVKFIAEGYQHAMELLDTLFGDWSDVDQSIERSA